MTKVNIKKESTKKGAVKEPKPEAPTMKCTMCGETKKEIDFYKSSSPIFKENNEKMCICKTCVGVLFEKYKNRHITDLLAVYEMCRTLDVYFNKSAYETAVAQAKRKSSNLASIYFQKVNSLPQWSGKTFDVSDSLEENDKKIDNGIDDIPVMLEITNAMIMKWGKLAREDIEFLENSYSQWITRHKCESKAEEILFEELCHMQLDIKKSREKGGDTIKKVEALQKIMLSANIRPVEQNAINSMESALMMGTIIGIIERNEPCEFFEEERRKEYKDFKGYRRYFDNWSLRPLKNLLTGSKDLNIVSDTDVKGDESDG